MRLQTVSGRWRGPGCTSLVGLLPWLWVILALFTGGCGYPVGGDGYSSSEPEPLPPERVIGPAGGSADPDGGGPVSVTVNGNVTYDRLAVLQWGLDATPTVETAAGVLVEAVAHDDITNVLATTTTGGSGAYALTFDTDVDYYIRARARAGDDGVYHSQTAPPILHAIPGAIQNRASGGQVVDLHGAYDLPYVRSGAFAILDTVGRLREAVAGSFPGLGPLDLFWGAGNQATRFLKDGDGNTITLTTETGLNGPIGNPSIYLRGGGSFDPTRGDHDEFDETVIAHEWASFLMLTRSRDNNFGGPHAGEDLIKSSAFSEGVVTAIGCALLDEPVYRDTWGWPTVSTGLLLELDCESGSLPGSGTGYSSEFEVTRVTWDLLDGGAGWPGDNDGDPAAVDAADFFASFESLGSRGAPYEVAWTASLLQQLIDDGHLTAMDADTIMQAHGAEFPPAGGDDFPAPLTLGVTETGLLDAWSGSDPNPVLGPQANGVWRLEVASAQSVTIDLTNTTGSYKPASHRLDLTVHALDRTIVAAEAGEAANKSTSVNLNPGTYIVRVQHMPASEAESELASYTLIAQ